MDELKAALTQRAIELELKPEITAPGGSIYSSLPFAQYGT